MPRGQAANDRMCLRSHLRRAKGSDLVRNARELCTRENDRLWSVARVRRAVEWDAQNSDRRAVIKFVQGGKGLRLVENSERVGIGQGAKGEAVRAIVAESNFVQDLFGFKGTPALNLRVIETGRRAGPEKGNNSRPDIVGGAYIKIGMRRPFLHNIEFQGKNNSGRSTFSINDIAQAFSAGRGADFSWVMIEASTRRRKSEKKYDEWERATWFADYLGVGILLYKDPRRISTWDIVLPAKCRRRSTHSKSYFHWFKMLLEEDKYPTS